jgi:hypothetical protein
MKQPQDVIDTIRVLWYASWVSGWVRRGRTLRTPSGPRGSSGKEAILGAAGLPIRIRLTITQIVI